MAIFGKGNGDDDVLHQILSELAALRQQMAGQQHAIDPARQDTNAAITTVFAEIRAAVRDGLERSRPYALAAGSPASGQPNRGGL
ncbi:hypothetical protein [Streptomyces sp. NPDC096311]|uniref:hypothetical protein n=1 Tax=Streptomyces sp. NPDC096311 TaxID=3366083 RepID=UPI00382865C7